MIRGKTIKNNKNGKKGMNKIEGRRNEERRTSIMKNERKEV